MIIVKMLFIILVLSLGIKIRLKISQEESVFVAVFGMIFITYILGLLNLLKFSIYLIILLTIISFIYVIIKLIKKEEKIYNLFTLPTLVYIVIMAFVWYIIKDIVFGIYDEFMLWGTNLKEMLNKSVLWANHQIDGIHLVYPPFTAVGEYIFCRFNGGFSESVTYYGLITMIFSCIMPLFKKEKYNLKSIFKVISTIVIGYVMICLFGFNIASLSVDCILAVTFSVAMFLSFKLENKKDYIVFVLLLIAITLIKTNGILFAGIVIMQIFFKIIFKLIKEKERNLKNILKKISIVILLLITIISSYGIWKIYYTLNGKQIDDRHDKNYVENIDLGEFINSIFQKESASKRNRELVKEFAQCIMKTKIIEKYYFYTAFWCFIIIDIGYIVYILINDKKMDIFINVFSINIGFILYMLTILLMFMFVFVDFQGRTLMGYDRYVATYLLAMGLNLLYLILDYIDIRAVLISIMIFIILQDGMNKLMLDPREVIRSEIEESTMENANNIIKSVDENEKIYLIDNNEDFGIEFMKLRYLISPIKTNLLYEWNIGVFDDGVYYRLILSEMEFMDKLISENYDYVYFVSIERENLEGYKNIISEDAKKELEDVVIDEKMFFYIKRTDGVLLKVNSELRMLEIVD